MKKRVYDFICTHPDTNIHDIAPEVNEPELEVLKTVNKLVEYSEGKCMLSPIGVLQAEVLLTK